MLIGYILLVQNFNRIVRTQWVSVILTTFASVVISKKKITSKCDIILEMTVHNLVNNIYYLWEITSDGWYTTKIKSSIEAKTVIQMMNSILCCKSLSLTVRKSKLEMYWTSPCGCESWNVNRQIRESLEATETNVVNILNSQSYLMC